MDVDLDSEDELNTNMKLLQEDFECNDIISDMMIDSSSEEEEKKSTEALEREELPTKDVTLIWHTQNLLAITSAGESRYMCWKY